MARQQWLISASSISAFKACPMRFYLGYVLGYQPVQETDSQRVGNRWHRALEILRHPAGPCACNRADCDFCGGTGQILEDRMAAIVAYLNRIYTDRPPMISEEDWLSERVVILNAIAAYKWHYENSPYKIIATELKFKLPLTSPETGAKLPDVSVVGKIDEIAQHEQTGAVLIGEHKSTSKSIDGTSSYWDNRKLDVQPSIYILAGRQLQLDGGLIPYGIKPDDPLMSGCLLDAFHKPGLSPKELTQADSKSLLETGHYYENLFSLARDKAGVLTVDDVIATTTPGKKEGTFSIRETPDMFGARLLTDMAMRPGYYFGQRELARTDQDLEKFAWQMYDMYQTARNMDKHNAWYTNESQCEATFKCQFCPVCYSGCQVGPDIIPSGFRVKGK